MDRPYDVVIVGAGPAGSLTAYHLAKAGFRVVLLDARRFPRPKTCGGGLQARAVLKIPFDIAPVLRGTMSQVDVSFGMGEPRSRTHEQALVYSVLRTEFDYYLRNAAERAGASVMEGVRARGVSYSEGGISVVQTDAGDFHGRVVVGADGANSVVSRLLNRREDYFWQTAVSCEVPAERFRNITLGMRIDWGSLRSGYAWMFPKDGFVNIGAGAPLPFARVLKTYARRFSDSLHLLGPAGLDGLPLLGHHLPSLTRRTRLANRGVLLVGDAAGLVEPFTGEGISSACHSAEIAAGCIRRALDSSSIDVSGYESSLRSELGPDLNWSRRLLALHVAFPHLVYRLFSNSDRVWSTFCRVLRGEESFQNLKKDVLGPLEFAWDAIEFFAQHRERRAMRMQPVLTA